MPCPYEAVASLHFPHLNESGVPISSKSKLIVLISPKVFKKFLYFSIPTFCAMRTAPILDDLIKICSALKFFGNLSCSLMVYLSQVMLFSKFLKIVLGFIILFSKAAAKVKVLNTDPNSYTPRVILFV